MNIKLKKKQANLSIGWAKPQLLQLINDPDTIILSNGKHSPGMFEATVIRHHNKQDFPTGAFGDQWSKDSWIPYDGKVILKND